MDFLSILHNLFFIHLNHCKIICKAIPLDILMLHFSLSYSAMDARLFLDLEADVSDDEEMSMSSDGETGEWASGPVLLDS